MAAHRVSGHAPETAEMGEVVDCDLLTGATCNDVGVILMRVRALSQNEHCGSVR